MHVPYVFLGRRNLFTKSKILFNSYDFFKLFNLHIPFDFFNLFVSI